MQAVTQSPLTQQCEHRQGKFFQKNIRRQRRMIKNLKYTGRIAYNYFRKPDKRRKNVEISHYFVPLTKLCHSCGEQLNIFHFVFNL